MKVSYNWLKDYVDLDVDPYLLAEKLSLIGFEVEEVIERRLDFPHVVVGKVLQVTRHPNADKLSLCQVDVGDARLQIVCGAPNVEEGQRVPVARVGAELPIGLKIKRAKIRGVESEGMICSEQELGLAESSDGIWVLPDDTPLGKPLAEALEFETDFILDIGVTPNRPDALGHIGIAREVAAILNRPLRKPRPEFPEVQPSAEEVVGVEIQSPDSCPRYAARVIRNVTVGPSPLWLVRRLEAVGMRAINNVVDVTNYVMLETGQPLHAFDLDLLEGGKIVVRESRQGEKFVTLDEKEHTLQEGTVLICDAQKPVAIGGIMGGLNSEVRSQTRNILLESAYFSPESIQRSARYLGIKSEASQRFEKGTDPNGVRYAQDRATQLLVQLAGGEVLQGAVDAYPRRIFPVKIPLKHQQINTLLGTRLSAEEMARILERIELKVEDGQVMVPTFRPDLTRVADLAEEVARLYGLENIPAAPVTRMPYRVAVNRFDAFLDRVRDVMVGFGVQEVLTNSMINAQRWSELTGEPVYPILNPISQDMSGLRNNLVLSLMGVIQWNVNRQIRDLRIFEINRVFYHPGDLNRQPREEIHLAFALTGNREPELWYSSRQLIDFYDVKGLIEAWLDKFSLDKPEFIYYDNFAVGKEALAVRVKGQQIGFFGRVKQAIQDFFDVETPIYVGEFDLKRVFELLTEEKQYRPIPRFPWVDRDLAVVVDETIEVAELIREIRNATDALLQDVFVFDIYRGKQIEAGKKSVAFRFIFQSPERTLTEEEVNQRMDAILKRLRDKFQAKLR
ncbi:MAG: phenylalanine--tRNA ligase subunit beta [Calditrichaeota bacterium]|nr:phenylalanine--tRNA ligase subunit beta [Calditrichota bacterium]